MRQPALIKLPIKVERATRPRLFPLLNIQAAVDFVSGCHDPVCCLCEILRGDELAMRFYCLALRGAPISSNEKLRPIPQ